MRIKTLLVLTALAATAMPAFAQGYGRSCQDVRANNQVGAAVVGSILGGVLGSNVAARGHRGDGTAVGAIVGGMIGAGVGGSATDCRRAYPSDRGYGSASGYDPNPNYGGPYYSDDRDYRSRDDDYGYAPDSGHSGYRYGDTAPHYGNQPPLDGGDYGSYNSDLDFAGPGCKDATQVTRLPDGSEVHRPVHVCRNPRTGDWQIRD